MILILEVTPPQAATLGSASRRVFSTRGGTIGRAASNDWVLSHRKVSGRHALITYQDAVFYIVDDGSANGVFINSTNNRLVPGKRYALKQGDRIVIDPYEIDVSMARGAAEDAPDPFSGFADDRAGGRPDDQNPFLTIDPFEPAPRRMQTPAGRTPRPSAQRPAGDVVPVEEVDPLKLLGGSSKPAATPQVPRARDLDRSSPLAGHYQPPAVRPPAPPAPVAGPHVIPADYDPLGDEQDDPLPLVPEPRTPEQPESEYPEREPEPPSVERELPYAEPPERGAAVEPPGLIPQPSGAITPPPAATPAPRDRNVTPSPAAGSAAPETAQERGRAESAPDRGLVEVLMGAGLEQAPVTLEFARSFGQIFRVVVSGVMDVLRARQQIKDEFRMRMTQFRPADNNPLKFSANVDDALHNLLVKRNAAYLEPVEAFEDAFDDLRNHQIAMLAGMRVAFESMLACFNPDQLQEQFDRQLKRSALLGMTARLRYWDLFRERHEEMVRDPEATFRRLFGEEFAKAYEEQLRRLKAEGQRPR